MSLQRPLEGLLRPPVEWYTTAVCFSGAAMISTYTPYFLMPTSLTQASILSIVVLGCARLLQGYRVWRYQRNLKRMPVYAISSQELPVSKKWLFLGKGFLWTSKHTQRLRDLDLSYNLAYRYPSKLYHHIRQLEFQWENLPFLKPIAALLTKNSVLNPVRPYPDIGGEPCIHGVSETESDVTLSLIERAGHVVVIGTTGVGKTRFAELLIAQDIRRGDVVMVLDPKGDSALLRRIYIEAKLAGRENDVRIIHLGFPEYSCLYNSVGSFTKITQVATRITNGLPSTGEAAAFKEFAWKYVNLVAKTLLAMSIRPTYALINFYITKFDELLVRYCDDIMSKLDLEYHRWIKHYMKEKKQSSTSDGNKPTRKKAVLAYAEQLSERRYAQGDYKNDLLADLLATCRLDKTYYDKITASVGPLLEKLTTGDIADLLSPHYDTVDDQRPILDWLQVIRKKQIVYIGMDALTDEVVSSTVGNAMLSDLVSVAGHIYNYGLDYGFKGLLQDDTPLPRINLHSDEFNEVIGNEFIPLLNKARGAGFNVIAYTQTWSDVEARLASTAKAGQVAGNLNVSILFRTKEAKTVNMLLEQLPKVPIYRVLPASGSSDTPHGEQGVFYQSTNEDRFTQVDVPLIDQNDVLNLPKGQAFCLLEGGKLHKIRVPLPKADDVSIPQNVAALISNMQTRQIFIKSKAERAI